MSIFSIGNHIWKKDKDEKEYKYYPPEMEPRWKDFLFKYWDVIGLVLGFIGGIILIVSVTNLCYWIAGVK